MLWIVRNVALVCALGMLGDMALSGQTQGQQAPFDVVIRAWAHRRWDGVALVLGGCGHSRRAVLRRSET